MKRWSLIWSDTRPKVVSQVEGTRACTSSRSVSVSQTGAASDLVMGVTWKFSPQTRMMVCPSSRHRDLELGSEVTCSRPR